MLKTGGDEKYNQYFNQILFIQYVETFNSKSFADRESGIRLSFERIIFDVNWYGLQQISVENSGVFHAKAEIGEKR